MHYYRNIGAGATTPRSIDTAVWDPPLEPLGDLAPNMPPDQLYSALGAEDFMNAVRMPKRGPLDVRLTAQMLGVDVLYDPDLGKHGTYSEDLRLVTIDASDRPGEQLVSFGHEVGHIFHDRILPDVTGDSEQLCEYFGYRMVFAGVSMDRFDPGNTDHLHKIAAQAGVGVVEALKYWIILHGRGRITITGRVGKNRMGTGEVRQEHFCRCRVLGGLSCDIKLDPVRIHLPDENVWGYFSNHDHALTRLRTKQ